MKFWRKVKFAWKVYQLDLALRKERGMYDWRKTTWKAIKVFAIAVSGVALDAILSYLNAGTLSALLAQAGLPPMVSASVLPLLLAGLEALRNWWKNAKKGVQ